MADDELAAVLAEIKERDRRLWAEFRVAASPAELAGSHADDTPRLLAALDAVLEMHALTATARYTEPCAKHLYIVIPRRDCPRCVKVERAGCQRCRDENGHPAKPEDCAERNAILRALTGKGNGGG